MAAQRASASVSRAQNRGSRFVFTESPFGSVALHARSYGECVDRNPSDRSFQCLLATWPRRSHVRACTRCKKMLALKYSSESQTSVQCSERRVQMEGKRPIEMANQLGAPPRKPIVACSELRTAGEGHKDVSHSNGNHVNVLLLHAGRSSSEPLVNPKRGFGEATLTMEALLCSGNTCSSVRRTQWLMGKTNCWIAITTVCPA